MVQDQCPFFTILPKEIRDMIFEYALIDCTSHPPNSDNKYRRGYQSADGSQHIPPSDIAFGLLLTCRVVYLEVYKLPLLLNPFIVYNFGHLPSYDVARPRFVDLAPWQFALIQRLDISLQQTALEGNRLLEYLETWKAPDRHAGCYIAPRFYQESRRTYPGHLVQSFNFGLKRTSEVEHASSEKSSRDGRYITLHNKSSFYSRNRSTFPIQTSAPAMLARPITHLTLRLSRTDWWTWGDHPTEADSAKHLGLDPACGDGGWDTDVRPTRSRMHALAAQRRASEFTNPNNVSTSPTLYENTWGAVVAKLPDLKVLELVLETFSRKKGQLVDVVECAKSWSFPLNESSYELIWDGKVEESNYSGEPTKFWNGDVEEYYPMDESEEEEGEEVEIEEELHTPTSPTADEEAEHEGYHNNGWVKQDTIYEVRIVRFKRRKIEMTAPIR